jgi:hypothetical protein
MKNISLKALSAMQHMLKPLCAAMLLTPLVALAQGNPPMPGRRAAPPGFTPTAAYSVNGATHASAQAAAPAQRPVTLTVTNAPSTNAVRTVQTYQDMPPAQTSKAYIATETEAVSQPVASNDAAVTSQGSYGNDYRPELSIWAPPTERVGDATQSALSMQLGGAHAGGALPTLGTTAGPAFKRYVDSFTHPLPEWFQEKVENKSN